MPRYLLSLQISHVRWLLPARAPVFYCEPDSDRETSTEHQSGRYQLPNLPRECNIYAESVLSGR